MWCDHCQQDVPGIASPGGEESIVCARCGEEVILGTGPEQPAGEEDRQSVRSEKKQTEEEKQPLEIDELQVEDWQIDDHLADARRLVALARPLSEDLPLAGDRPAEVPLHWRADPVHGPTSAPTSPRQQQRHRRRRQNRPSLVAWSLLSLGLMAFVCGAVLLGWSLVGGRDELWSLGMPLVFAGQAGLLLGLVFQLDGLWRTNRDTSASLKELDEQITDLKTATSLLGTTHSSGARSFYAHLAEGASPQMLLSDLKGQMDMLALRMDKRNQ